MASRPCLEAHDVKGYILSIDQQADGSHIASLERRHTHTVFQVLVPNYDFAGVVKVSRAFEARQCEEFLITQNDAGNGYVLVI